MQEVSYVLEEAKGSFEMDLEEVQDNFIKNFMGPKRRILRPMEQMVSILNLSDPKNLKAVQG